jgi:hypothetical protein
MFKWVMFSAAVLSGTLLAGQAGAVTKELVGVDASGNTFSSGWQYEVSDAQAADVNLVFIRSEGNNFFFEKDATLRSATDPININFTKIGGASAANLVINDEALNNLSGSALTGFRFVVSSGSVGGVPNFVLATHDGSSGIGDFRIDPFTTFAFENNSTELVLGGGTVPNNSSWFPGSMSNTGLAIRANAADADSFTLKEIPITVPIPLPAAAWTGLTGLVGIIVARATKHARV